MKRSLEKKIFYLEIFWVLVRLLDKEKERGNPRAFGLETFMKNVSNFNLFTIFPHSKENQEPFFIFCMTPEWSECFLELVAPKIEEKNTRPCRAIPLTLNQSNSHETFPTSSVQQMENVFFRGYKLGTLDNNGLSQMNKIVSKNETSSSLDISRGPFPFKVQINASHFAIRDKFKRTSNSKKIKNKQNCDTKKFVEKKETEK